jgi:hypothetical protein
VPIVVTATLKMSVIDLFLVANNAVHVMLVIHTATGL